MSQIRRGGTKQSLGGMMLAMDPCRPSPHATKPLDIRNSSFFRPRGIGIYDNSSFVPEKSGSTTIRHSSALRPSRPALTLLEVLIAMFILAIGLLGVASLLPVGQFQVRQGSDDLRAAELAEQAFGAIETHGVTDPARWMAAADYGSGIYYKFVDAVDPTNGTRMAWTVAAGSTASSIVGIPPSNPPFIVSTGFEDLTGCVVEFVRGKLRGARRRVNAYNSATGTFTFNGTGQAAPFSAVPDAGDVFVVIRNQAFAVDPYFIVANGAASNTFFADGVPRVTLTQTASDTAVMEDAVVKSIFLPDDDQQGDFSWLATLVPGEGGIFMRDYTVSVAVFRKRGLLLPIDDQQRKVNLAFAFDGKNLGGGTATLSVPVVGNVGFLFEDRNGNGTFDAETERSRFVPQQWLLVSNRTPNTALTDAGEIPTKVYRWYRIGSVGDPYPDNDPYTNVDTWNLDVQLIGADWDTTVLGGAGGTPTATAMATVYDDVIAVFQRRLQVKALPVGTTN